MSISEPFSRRLVSAATGLLMKVSLLKTYTGQYGSFMREGVAPTLAKVLHKDIELGVWAATMSQSDFMKEVKGIKFKCGAALIEIL